MSAHLGPEELELAAKGGAQPAHLGGCAECRAAVASARARQKLLGGLRPHTLSDDAFRRSEAQVLARVREQKAALGWRLWLPLGLVAAAALAFFVARPAPVVEPPARVAQVPEEARPEAALQPRAWSPLEVALASAAERREGDGWVAVQAGEVLAKPTALRAARLVLVSAGLVLDGAPAAVLGPKALAELEAQGARLDVDQAGAEAVVRVGPRWLKSSDAAYLAARAAAAVDLDVRRGEVWVADDASFARAVRVAAPAAVRLVDGAAEVAARGAEVAAAPKFRPAGKAAGRLSFDPRLPLGDRVSLDDAALGGAPLSLMLPAGRHRLRFFSGDKAVGERWCVAQAEGTVTLEEPKGGTRVPAMGEEEQQRLLAFAVREQKNKFSACYEKWLKNERSAGGTFSVAVVISERGKVKSVEVSGMALPPPVADCVRRTAQGFRFPAMGEEVELEIPVQMARP